MSGTMCCYKGCSKSYSQDKEVIFFKFPDDPKRRKRWMDNCGVPELHSLNERQLRLKRVCAAHFSSTSFTSAEARTQLTEKAVPLSQKEHAAAAKAAEEAQKEQALNPKRGRGRPPAKFSLGLVKKEPSEDKTKDEEEDDIEEEEEEEGDEPAENGGVDYSPPPTLRKQRTVENSSNSVEVKGKGTINKPPKLVAAVSSGGDTTPLKTITKVIEPRAKSSASIAVKSRPVKIVKDEFERRGNKRMADLSVIEDVVREMSMSKSKKRQSVHGLSDASILSKRMKPGLIEGDDDVNSEDDLSEMDDSDEDDEEGMEKANREFEMFQEGMRKVINLPPNWAMGGVVWDPLNKMKVIALSEVDIQKNGIVRLFRSIQIFEDSTVKVKIDGVDMTLNFGIQSIETEADVNRIITAVSEANVCTGVRNFQPDDIIYLPDARKRGCIYYSDACPVILDQNVQGSVCNPCMALQNSLFSRKEKEKEEIATRKMRTVSKNLKNDFGRAIYGLLNEILDDSNALKSDKKQERDAVLSKYSTELGVMNGEIQKPEKLPQVHVSVDEVSASFQDIVARLGFSKNKKPGAAGPSTSNISTPIPVPQQRPPQVSRPKPKEEDVRTPFASKSFLSKYNNPPVSRKPTVYTPRPTMTSTPISLASTTSSTSFSLGDGQTYEILGEVGGSEVTKGEAIEIIEVDDETMAKLTAQNSGMIFQNSTPGAIQVSTLDPSDPNISQILKAINPSQA